MADLILLNTDELRDLYLRDFKIRLPSASTARGTAPYVDAVTLAGVTPALFKNAVTAADRALIGKTFGSELDILATDKGKPRLQGSGSFGAGTITTATTGATVSIGMRLRHADTGELFVVTSATGTYFTGNTIAVKSVGVGRQTNVSGKLLFDSPSAGLNPELIVTGKLAGGADIESDSDLQARLIQLNAAPPADGNVGSYLQLIYAVEHGVPVHQAFVYPSILAPGTVGVTFTVTGTGAGRIPTAPQLAAVETHLKNNVPFDDCIFMLAVSQMPSGDARAPIIGIKFVTGETGFVDPDYFPKYDVPAGVTSWTVNNSPAPRATVFSIQNNTGVYTDSGIRAGQTIALWNGTKFVNKRILSFTGTGPYTITVDTSVDVSNTTYVPFNGQLVSPWSNKLNDISASVLAYYDKLSPGENTNSLPDPGYRMRRFPYDSIDFPYGVTSRVTDEISDRSDIQSVSVLRGLTAAPTPGTPGVNVFMFVLNDLAFYGILKCRIPLNYSKTQV
jgi:uncharacterized phage protein gp47/JayE